MVKAMYKVTRLDNFKIVLFESKENAVEYIELMKTLNIICSLNIWTWLVKVEE